jgi:hypothetical protein
MAVAVPEGRAQEKLSVASPPPAKRNLQIDDSA